jgi:uncharacterized protein with HEPN domain
MPPKKKDLACLWDILDAARAIEAFTNQVSFEQYLKDRKVQMAVERALEIIGIAARHVSESFQADHSDIPWKRMIGLRNVLAHEYGEIRQERIWAVVVTNVPELIRKIEPLVPKTAPSD